MRLLFIKLKHIGDSLLLTPTLVAARRCYPEARICVVVRSGCEEILHGCPAIDQIYASAAPEPDRRSVFQFWREARLIQKLRREHFDFAFELGDGDRGRWLAVLSGARKRCASQVGTRVGWLARRQFQCLSDYDWRFGHRVEKDFRTVNACLPLGETIPPLCFERARAMTWAPATGWEHFAVLHPGTRWRRKRWPVEQWIQIGKRLLSCVSRLVVSSGPAAQERAEAGQIASALGALAVNIAGQTTWAELAGLLYRASLFVGVDTAAMHLAAACQCPTVAIFGPSVESAWRPWQVPHRLVLPPDAAIAPGDSDYFRKKEELNVGAVPVEEVWKACLEMLEQKRASSGRAP